MSRITTAFERFENKYWVPGPLIDELLQALRPHLRRDGWAERGQRNTSLYLDSSEHDFLQLHTEAAPDRVKLRVRAYGDPPSGPAFFEIKRKVKAVTVKRRAVVPLEAVPALLGGGPAPPLHTAEEERTLAHFLYLTAVYRAEPQVLLTCRREAYAGADAEEGVRVTLDRDIRYQPAPGPTLTGDARAWVPLGGAEGGGGALVELKFEGVAPLWLVEIVERLGLTPAGFSKYVAAMRQDEMTGWMGSSLHDALDLAPVATPVARAPFERG